MKQISSDKILQALIEIKDTLFMSYIYKLEEKKKEMNDQLNLKFNTKNVEYVTDIELNENSTITISINKKFKSRKEKINKIINVR